MCKTEKNEYKKWLDMTDHWKSMVEQAVVKLEE